MKHVKRILLGLVFIAAIGGVLVAGGFMLIYAPWALGAVLVLGLAYLLGCMLLSDYPF
jgi:hypothetical protein